MGTLQLFSFPFLMPDRCLTDVIPEKIGHFLFQILKVARSFRYSQNPSESQLIRVDLGKASSAQRSGAIACRSESLGFQNTSPETRLKSLCHGRCSDEHV